MKEGKRRILAYYERRGPAAWLAHLDMMRLFERALSRAGWPLSWTEDAFNPRPGIVFALPVGLGIETRRDPLEMTLLDPEGGFRLEGAVEDLNRALPAGVLLVGAQEEEGGGKSLMARVKAAQYLLEAPGAGPAFRSVFESGGPVEVERLHRKKRRVIDLAPRLLSLDSLEEDRVVFTGGAGSRDHLRLDLLLDALVKYGGLDRETALGSRLVRLAVFLDPVRPDKGIIV